MKLIKLPSNQCTVIDDVDYERVVVFGGWHVGSSGYVMSDKRIDGKRVMVHLHRFIHPPALGMVVDHKNQDKLDNRRDNLRDATKSLNALNSKISTTNKSGRKGVSWHRGSGRWRAALWLDGRQIHLGFFDDIELASQAYQSRLAEVVV